MKYAPWTDAVSTTTRYFDLASIQMKQLKEKRKLISNDKWEYLFSLDNTFEIHDDIEVHKLTWHLVLKKVCALYIVLKMIPFEEGPKY